MAKMTAWLVTIIGAVLTLQKANLVDLTLDGWLIPVVVLIVGIGKLMRNYQKKKRR